MTLLFSKAMMEHCENLRSSQEQEGAFLEGSFSDGKQYAQLNVMPTPHKFWRNDKTMEFSKLFQFGLTLQLLTETHGEELLMLYLADFHAKTLVSPEGGLESKANEAECGKNFFGLLAIYDQDLSLWKTAQCSLVEDLELYSETWPRQGMMRNGRAYLRLKLERITCEIESGYWVTPTIMDKLPPKSSDALHREATIVRPGRAKPANLRDQVSNMQNWPTPTASQRGDCPSERNRRTPTLASAVVMFPTPQASDNRDRGNLSSGCVKRRIEKGKQISLSQSVSETSGQLNPNWVEWLMGWPIGWTDLKPLETDKSL